MSEEAIYDGSEDVCQRDGCDDDSLRFRNYCSVECHQQAMKDAAVKGEDQ